ncbi:phosphate acyltransferase [Haloferula helveola]|uniref:Phosphate acyltransferase n=1 Tax=Haloferula helveola TaxID=490095 RepID=A0ABM7RFU4_9BACT|nr:phosphate acyltransferase [Haloferula helveola]
MRVALDAMGGDRAPAVNLEGGADALRRYPSLTTLLVVGDEEILREEAPKHGLDLADPRVKLVHAPEVIGMSEPGAKTVRRKKQSSISVAMDLVKAGEADAFVSAGNTGACVAAAQLKLRLIPGIERAGIASGLPNEFGPCHLLDAGANPEAKPTHLLGYAIMGSAFAKGVYGVALPKVGIMSNGEEDEKGTAFTKQTFALIKEFVATGRAPFEFVGNVEGHDLFERQLDVCLCDGFTGNVVLKSCEATAKAMSKWLKQELLASPVRKLGAMIAKGAFVNLKERANAEAYGGSPLLGVNGVVIIAHGGSTATAMRNAIRAAVESVNHKVNDHIIEALEGISKMEGGES